MKLPDDKTLNILWTMETSTSIKTGTPTPKMGETTPIMSTSETDQ